MGIHGPAFAFVIIAPAFDQKLLPAQHPVFVLHEAEQKRVFFRRQGNFLLARKNLPGGAHKSDAARFDAVAGKDAAFIALDERHGFSVEHGERKRFGDIIVRAELISQEFIFLIGKGGEEKDGHIVGFAHCAAHRKPIEHRHHNIEQDCIEFVLFHARKRLESIASFNGALTPAGEIIAQNFPQLGFILYD